MKHTVDIETWERRDNYAFFRNFLNSWISVATEIDCTEARAAAKAAGRSFFRTKTGLRLLSLLTPETGA